MTRVTNITTDILTATPLIVVGVYTALHGIVEAILAVIFILLPTFWALYNNVNDSMQAYRQGISLDEYIEKELNK